MECANEDLLVFNEFSCDLLDFKQKKRILFFSLKLKKKKRKRNYKTAYRSIWDKNKEI